MTTPTIEELATQVRALQKEVDILKMTISRQGGVVTMKYLKDTLICHD